MNCKAKRYHQVLAEYFKAGSKSAEDSGWYEKPRKLSELPFHLAGADRIEELEELLSSLPYLAARIATGSIYTLLTDFSLTGKPLSPEPAEWLNFLRKRSQRLHKYPRMLPALVNHEGFAAAHAQLNTVAWRFPWLRTKPEPLPNGSDEPVLGLGTIVLHSFESNQLRIAVLAVLRQLVFFLERLGVVRMLDVREMRETGTTLSIRSDRPLTLVCPPDAKSLTVFFESGDVIVYRCRLGADDKPVMLETIAEAHFKIPESHDPIAVWHNGAVWFQAPDGHLTTINTESGKITEETIAHGVNGELAALVFSGNSFFAALRNGEDILLFKKAATPVRRRYTDIATACACDANKVAVAFTDGSLVLYDLTATIEQVAYIPVGFIEGACGWDGKYLLWLEQSPGFHAWLQPEPRPRFVDETDEVFPKKLDAYPKQWASLPDGNTLLLTNHNVVIFRLVDGQHRLHRTLDAFFGGPVWRIVWRHERNHWLAEGTPLRETLIGSGIMGRLCCAHDGRNHFFTAEATGGGCLVDLTTLARTALYNVPELVNVAAGDTNGGCWFTDRRGVIYYAGTNGYCRELNTTGLTDIRGARLQSCGEYIVWWGYSAHWFPESGSEWARTFVLFRKHANGELRLDYTGQQVLHPREGICIAVHYDAVKDRLVTLWSIEGRGGYRLRVGKAEDFLAWQVYEQNLNDLPAIRIVQSALSADGGCIMLLSIVGKIVCINVDDGRVITNLAGSNPFIAISVAEGATSFWAVEQYGRVYHCEIKQPV